MGFLSKSFPTQCSSFPTSIQRYIPHPHLPFHRSFRYRKRLPFRKAIVIPFRNAFSSLFLRFVKPRGLVPWTRCSFMELSLTFLLRRCLVPTPTTSTFGFVLHLLVQRFNGKVEAQKRSCSCKWDACPKEGVSGPLSVLTRGLEECIMKRGKRERRRCSIDTIASFLRWFLSLFCSIG